MSKYTTEVRFICEMKSGLRESVGFNNIDDVLEKSWDKIFTSKCYFFEEDYRKILCKKILKHYYTREIGAETVGLWQLWVNTKLEEIMPYYNELYKSAKLEFDPFNDVNVTRVHDELGVKENNTHNVSNTNYNSKNKNKFSDTPQGGLNGIENDTYLTNATIDEMSSSTDSNDNGTLNENNSVKYTEKYSGKQGTTSYSKLLIEYRKTILNIDLQVIKEFEDCFLKLW